ncbi:MAG: hypothetical protein AAB955_03345 [Patescibacteria group bacterium]
MAIIVVALIAPVSVFAWRGTWSFQESCNSSGTIDVTATYHPLDSHSGTVRYTSPHLNLATGAIVTVNLFEDVGQHSQYTVTNIYNCHPPVVTSKQYCSPGYWKQSHHFDSYVTYSPTDSFNTVFGRNAFPGKTLVQVLSQGGGGLNAYGRKAVGALLNSTSMSSGLTAGQVIAKFQATYDGAPSGKAANEYYGAANPEFTQAENCPLN